MAFYLKRIFIRKTDKGPKLQIQIQFLKRLHQLLNNGYSLNNSLQIIQLDRDLSPFTKRLQVMLIEGLTLGNALKKLNFHPLISNFLRTVESTGNLKKHIKTCIKIAEQERNYLGKLRQVVRYPILLAIFFIILFLVINIIVLPSFETIVLAEEHSFFFGGVRIIRFSLIIIGLLILLLAVIVYFRKHFSQIIPVEKRIKILQKIPLLNYLATLHTTFLFSAQLSTLLNSGMSFKKAFIHLSEQAQMPVISYYAKVFMSHFEKGENIIQPLLNLPLLDQQLATLFQNTTNIKQLSKDLMMFEAILFDEFESTVIRVIQFIQPIFFSTLSLFIIFLYLSILWPMFDVIKNL